MTVLKQATTSRWIGLAADAKPTNVPPGSTYLAYDTQALYITHDGTLWVLKDATGEVQASPTSNTVLDRIKALLTGIVLAAGSNVIGKVGIDQTTPGTTNRVDAQLSGLSKLEDNLFEWTSSTWIAAQALTADGVQWSDEKTQSVGGAETQVFGAIVEPPKGGTLVAVILGLTCQLKSGEATAAKTWQWKARNKAGTWVNLHAAVSENLTTSYVEKYRSGVFYAVTNFNEVPFEIGLFCTPHASTASATIISQVKNSCTVVALYEAD